MVWSPIGLLPEHHEETASGWRQLVGVSYMWWALAVIATAGITLTAAPPARKADRPAAETPATASPVG
jgi:alpha-1,2-mannosyltransferase